ncbi:MAG: creatininase family protein [Candidatus Dormiibacterota bacterium]
MPASIHFADLTSPRARALLDAGPAPVLLLPVGAVEPHGPHAPLRTDSIISLAVCERAATELTGDRRVRALVLPEIAFGITRYSAAFTGAVTISEATLLALIVEVCASLRAQGFRHIVLVNSHFEPAHVATLRQAAEQADVGFLDLTRRAMAEQLTEEFQSGAAHAGRYETSIVLATQPELVETDVMRRLPALRVNMPAAMADGRTDFLAMGMDRAYCGAPAEATAREGDSTLVMLAGLLIDLIRKQAEPEPAP